jgi:hypothetical protein
MMSMTTPGIALLFAALLAPSEDTAARGVRTEALAASLEKKVEDFERRQKTRGVKDETIAVSEGELNSYLNLSPKLELPPGISDVQFLFDRDAISATGQLDLDVVRGKEKVGNGPLDPLSLLSGNVPVELAGRLRSEGEGFGAFEIQSVRLGPVSLPVSVLARIVAAATRTAQNPEGFDLGAPFRLPYSLKRVRIQPGRALLDF